MVILDADHAACSYIENRLRCVLFKNRLRNYKTDEHHRDVVSNLLRSRWIFSVGSEQEIISTIHSLKR